MILSLQGLAGGMLGWWLTCEVGIHGDFARLTGLLATFGDSGSPKQNCYSRVGGGKLEVLFYQWTNEQPYRYKLCYYLAFTKRGQEPGGLGHVWIA